MGPMWPLPPRYWEYMDDENWCRMARINACLQWQLPDLRDRGSVFARCLHFFDRVYLRSGDELGLFGGQFDDAISNFYDGVVVETPRFHHDSNRLWMNNRNGLMIQVMGRGTAKTTNILRRNLMLGLTGYLSGTQVVRHQLVYTTSTHTLAKRAGRRIKHAYSDNEKIQFDWAPFMPGGRIQGRRGEKPFGDQEFGLTNGAMFQFMSTGSAQRGMRPIVYELDDPEEAGSATTDRTAMREDLKERILKVYYPMLTAPDARMCWTGTFIDTQALLWRAVQRNADGERTLPEFNAWEHYVVKLIDEMGESTWPHMFPVDEAQKVRLKLPRGTKTIAQKRLEMGEARFQAEMMANPGRSNFGVFKIDNDPRGHHAWWIEQPDDAWAAGEPYRSEALACWKGWDTQDTHKIPLKELLGEGYVFATLDTSATASETSDRKVVHVMAFTPDRSLLSLDLWSAQCHEQDLIAESFRMCRKWLVRILWPEVVARQASLYENMASQVIDGFHREKFNVQHSVGVRPLRVGQSSKNSKINGMVNWFDMKRVKLPMWRKLEGPYGRLIGQVEGFNPEFQSGGLTHDDELDTLAMVQFVTKMNLDRVEHEEAPKNVYEMIEMGYTHEPNTGIPLISYLDFNSVPAEVMARLVQNRRTEEVNV